MHPLYEPERQEISTGEIEAINREIVLSFVRDVRVDGAIPMVVDLPSESEIPTPWWEPIGLKILRDANIPHLDLRACMSAYNPAVSFRPREAGGDYSEEGNEQVAQCLFEPIKERLRSRLRETAKASER